MNNQKYSFSLCNKLFTSKPDERAARWISQNLYPEELTKAEMIGAIAHYWDEETTVNVCMNMAYMIAKFFGNRYQVCYGLHKTNFYNVKNEYIKTDYHLHMIFNSVSYIDGQMLEISEEDFYAFKEYISLISHYSIEKVNYSENLIEVLV